MAEGEKGGGRRRRRRRIREGWKEVKGRISPCLHAPQPRQQPPPGVKTDVIDEEGQNKEGGHKRDRNGP